MKNVEVVVDKILGREVKYGQRWSSQDDTAEDDYGETAGVKEPNMVLTKEVVDDVCLRGLVVDDVCRRGLE